MNLGSLFGAITGTIGKIATVAFSIGKVALPILKGLRSSVEEVDAALDKFEDIKDKGGVAADDWFDHNIETIKAVENTSGRMIVAMTMLNDLTAKCRIYSQEQTPETITDEEMIDLGKRLYDFREFFSSMKPEVDETIKMLESMSE